MGALLAILLTLGPTVASQVTLPPTDEQERAAMIQQIETELAQLPKVKPQSIDQIIKFGIERNMLSLRTELSPQAESASHIITPDLNGYVRVTLLGPQDDAETRGRNFTYLQQDLTNPKSMVITTISSIAGQINVARDGEDDRFHWSIQYVQDPPPMNGTPPEQDPVRFLVQRFDDQSPDKNVDLKLSAPDFMQLRSAHPAELDQYLRPILRDFKQEAALFAVPPQVAWQVLGDRTKADPKLLERIQQILARLDSESFRDRQDAAEQLKQLGQPAALALGKIDRSRLTPQQSSAVDTFLAEFAPLANDKLSGLTDDKGFLLDVLFNDDAALQELALARLSKLTGRRIDLPPGLDASSRAEAITRLRLELIPTTQPALDRMAPK